MEPTRDASHLCRGDPVFGCLEILVNYAVLPRDFVVTPIRIPFRIKAQLARNMPQGWQNREDLTRMIGAEGLSEWCVLEVPSAIIPEESNYIINPEHPQFRDIEFLPSEPFHFDSRLR